VRPAHAAGADGASRRRAKGGATPTDHHEAVWIELRRTPAPGGVTRIGTTQTTRRTRSSETRRAGAFGDVDPRDRTARPTGALMTGSGCQDSRRPRASSSRRRRAPSEDRNAHRDRRAPPSAASRSTASMPSAGSASANLRAARLARGRRSKSRQVEASRGGLTARRCRATRGGGRVVRCPRPPCQLPLAALLARAR